MINLKYSSSKIIFSFIFLFSDFNFGMNSIFDIFEFDLTDKLVMHGTEECVTKYVILIIIYDWRSIWELD